MVLTRFLLHVTSYSPTLVLTNYIIDWLNLHKSNHVGLYFVIIIWIKFVTEAVKQMKQSQK